MYYKQKKSLERLYLNFISDKDEYAELPETIKTRDTIDGLIEKNNSQYGEQLQDLICGYGDGKEKQGFINGFRCAFSLILEATGKM